MKDSLRVIDGGYAGWVYGSRDFSWKIWQRVREKYQGCIILMDSPSSYRKEFYPPYKAHREEKRKKSEYKQRTKEKVVIFQGLLEQDEMFDSLRIWGHEADDLVAVSLFFARKVSVLGADKDLLQLPWTRTHIEKIDGSKVVLETFLKRTQKTLQPHLKDEWDILLYLSLMGDKSDDVPRLIPPYKLELMVEILKKDKPFSFAQEKYGEDFCRNLALTILPAPWVFDPVPELETLPSMIEDNSYFTSQKLTKHLSGRFKEVL